MGLNRSYSCCPVKVNRIYKESWGINENKKSLYKPDVSYTPRVNSLPSTKIFITLFSNTTGT